MMGSDVEKIRERTLLNVRALSDDQAGAVDDAISRLVEKPILHRDEGTVQLKYPLR